VAGELVKLGDWVYTDAQIGDRVIVSGLTRCGYCDSCRKGMDNICDNSRKKFAEIDVLGPAGLGEYVLVEDYQLFKASNNVPFEELALTEPLACVLRSVRKAGVQPTDKVVVVGAGIMGVLHILLAKKIGAHVIVSEPNAKRAAFACEIGADAVIDPVNEPFAEKVIELTGGRGADVIFNAVSIASAVEQSVAAVGKSGRVMVYASIHPRGTKITIDPNPFHGKEIVLSGTMSQDNGDFLQATRMISDQAVDLKPFVSKVLPFNQLEEAIEVALTPETYRVVVAM
jgi:L-iditol 2-dehydrogenase